MNYFMRDHHRNHKYSNIPWRDEKGEALKSGKEDKLRQELKGFLQGGGGYRSSNGGKKVKSYDG